MECVLSRARIHHAIARTSTPPIRHLAGSQQLHASLRHEGWPSPARSFRMVGLIVDVSPCTPVTKKTEGCSTPT
ncbi:unnamed protein product [Lasius platythorax]|uniref:Uncharacterized protein n=1 Tax=Lasius platythorax TaxID=488582 RepID=A0AAV2PAS4_9HYME